MKHWHTIITFDQPHQAHMAKNLLETEGIVAMVRDELTVQSHNFYSNAIGGIKLDVNNDCVDDAIRILKNGGYLNNTTEDPKANQLKVVSLSEHADKTTCPYCASKEIQKDGKQKKLIIFFLFLFGQLIPLSFVMGNQTIGLVTIAVAVITIVYTYMRQSYTCFECTSHWRYKK